MKLPGLVSGTMKTYNDAKSKTVETKDKPKKKKNKKRQYVYLGFIFFKKKVTERQKNFQVYAD